MKRFLGFIFMILASFCNTCLAEIIRATDTIVIENILKSADKDTLVIFDVDDVLLMPKDQILQTHNAKYLATLNKKLERSIGENNAKIFYGIIFEQHKKIPVDTKMKDMITELQSEGIKVLALTNYFTGKFGKVKSMENLRYLELKENGYYFDQSWQSLQTKTFEGTGKIDHDLSARSNSKPMFFKGIVFTTTISKGDALEAFLQYANFTPKKIIFIDDKNKNIESVQNTASSHNIAFTGVEYTAVNHMQTEPLNEKRANMQYEILEQEKKWLSDDETDKLSDRRN